jgi:hypothetical protein
LQARWHRGPCSVFVGLRHRRALCVPLCVADDDIGAERHVEGAEVDEDESVSDV